MHVVIHLFISENYLSRIYFGKLDLLQNGEHSCNIKKEIMTPFYGWGSTVSRLQSHYEETVYFLPFSSQEILVLNWLTSEKDEKLSWPWSLPVVLKPGPMEYESSTLTTRLLILFHNCNFSHWFTFNLN